MGIRYWPPRSLNRLEIESLVSNATSIPILDGVASNVQDQINSKASLAQTMEVVTTSRALTNADSGKILLVSNGITITVAGLNAGERIDFINQDGSTITFAAGGMAILDSKDGAVTLSSAFAAASIVCWSPGMHYYLIGDIA